ncbi:MAG: hypothetical protein FD149_1895 [Rhodospirillaceae bacterium]|nr:MAG: hypothetical protein FD149_1895 [Rhodospirillaceae bacterium]
MADVSLPGRQDGRQTGSEGLALAGGHFGHGVVVQGQCAHDLHRIGTLAQRALRRLDDQGQRRRHLLERKVRRSPEDTPQIFDVTAQTLVAKTTQRLGLPVDRLGVTL